MIQKITSNSLSQGISSTLLRANGPPFIWPPTPVTTVSTVAATHDSGVTPVSAPVRTVSTVAPTHVSGVTPISAPVLCTHNVGEGRSLIFTLVKGMFTIIKKGTNDWIE